MAWQIGEVLSLLKVLGLGKFDMVCTHVGMEDEKLE